MLKQNATTWTWRAAATVALLAALVAAGLFTLRPASADPGDAVALPDLVADSPEDPVIYDEDTAGADPVRLLRFDGYIHNAGPGELMVFGHRENPGDEIFQVRQIFAPLGESGRRSPLGEWVRDVVLPRAQIKYDTGDGHDHFHLDRISRYSLWNAERTAVTAPAMKIGFCLTDSRRIETNGPTERYWDADRISPCGQGDPEDDYVEEGISPGWRDWYRAGIAYQWIDISNVLPGSYWLRADIDPDEYVIEANETNPPAYMVQPTIVPGFNAIPGSAQTDEDRSVDVTLTAQRWSGGIVGGQPGATRPTFAIVDGPDHGTLGAISADGTVRYTPGPGYHGPDSFTFSARDGTSPFPTSPATAAVTLQVNEVEEPSVTIGNVPPSMVAGTSVQLTADVVDDDPAVQWSATAGSIDSRGFYTAPAEPPAGGDVTITARSANAQDSVTIAIDPAPRPTVTINGAQDRIVAGTRLQLTASVVDDDLAVDWSATAGSIDSDGLYTAPDEPPAGDGKVTITARSANAQDSVTIEIEPRPVVPEPSVTIHGAPTSMVAGETITLTATVEDDEPGVTWSTTHGTIDQEGRLTAPGEPPAGDGRLHVTARSANAEASVTIEVRAREVVPDPTVTIGGGQARLVAGQSIQLTATVLNDPPAVAWSASAGTINSGGLYTAPDEPPVGGTVTITARSANAQASIEIVIDPRPVVPPPTVTIVGAPASMEVGETKTLSATVENDDPGVTWSTTHGEIDPQGRLTAPDAPPPLGTLQVTARSANAQATVTIEVTSRRTLPQPKVTIESAPGIMLAGETTQLRATVIHDVQGVTWTATAGTITPDGSFTAPDPPPAGGKVTVTARSASGATDARVIEIRAKPAPPQPVVAISGAPEKLVVGTTVQLSATVVDDLPSVSWSASAGTITPEGAYTAPAEPPAGGTVQVTAKSSRASDTRTIAIEPRAPVIPRPLPEPPSDDHHHHHGNGRTGGSTSRPKAKRPLSAIAAARIGRQLVMTVTPSKSGRLRLTAYLGRRKLGGCVARVPSRRLFTCRIKLGRSVSARARIRIVAGLRTGKKVSRVERRAAPVGKAHAH